MIAGLLGALFGRLVGRYRGALLAAVGILLYTLLVGAGASVVRAALMGGYRQAGCGAEVVPRPQRHSEAQTC